MSISKFSASVSIASVATISSALAYCSSPEAPTDAAASSSRKQRAAFSNRGRTTGRAARPEIGTQPSDHVTHPLGSTCAEHGRTAATTSALLWRQRWQRIAERVAHRRYQI
jgi:hypothetical protein